MQAPRPEESIGPYRLFRPLGKGGMGQVFLAVGEKGGVQDKLVVVKVLLPELVPDAEMRSMFLHEARLGAMLAHPNIAQILDYGEANGTLYLALEYIDGPPLSYITRHSPDGIPLAIALRIVADIAAALAHAHSAVDKSGHPLKIVHRDVTPQNVLVARDGRVKLIDFGVARSSNQDHRTRTGVLKGKLTYMAPEQYKGKVNNQTDIFALGVILHELVSGKRLFRRPTEAETIAAVLMEPIPPITATPEVAHAIQPIVSQALARDMDERLSDVRTMETMIRDAMRRLGLHCSERNVAGLVSAVDAAAEHQTAATRQEVIVGATAIATSSGMRFRPDEFDRWRADDDSSSLAPVSDSSSLSPARVTSEIASDRLAAGEIQGVPTKMLDAPRTSQLPTTSMTPPSVRSLHESMRPEHPPILPSTTDLTDAPTRLAPPRPSSPAPAFPATLARDHRVAPAASSPPKGPESQSFPTAGSQPSYPYGLSGSQPTPILLAQRAGGAVPSWVWVAAAMLGALVAVGVGAAAVMFGGDHSRATVIPPATVQVGTRSPSPPAAPEAREPATPVHDIDVPPALEPIVVEAPTASPGTSPRPAPGTSPRPRPPAVERDTTAGRLFLDTQPWSQVSIAGRSLGDTPIVGAELPPGRYTARLRTADGTVHRERIEILPGRPTKRTIVLR